MSSKKLVDFEKYCPKCMYFSKIEDEEPCIDCLLISARIDSHRPEYFKDKIRTKNDSHNR